MQSTLDMKEQIVCYTNLGQITGNSSLSFTFGAVDGAVPNHLDIRVWGRVFDQCGSATTGHQAHYDHGDLMKTETIADEVASAQAKADVVQQVVDHLRDSSKTLSNGTRNALINYAQTNARRFSTREQNAVATVVLQHQYAFRKLENHLVPVWNLMRDLQKELSDIRKYLEWKRPKSYPQRSRLARRAELPKVSPAQTRKSPAPSVPASTRLRRNSLQQSRRVP